MSDFIKRRNAQLAAEQRAKQEYELSDEALYEILEELELINYEAEQENIKYEQHMQELARINAINKGLTNEIDIKRFVKQDAENRAAKLAEIHQKVIAEMHKKYPDDPEYWPENN